MFQSLVQARLHGQPPSALDPQAAQLPDHERAAWVEVNTLAYNREGLQKREERQRPLRKWLQRWKLLHIPLAAIFFGLVAVHILDVFGAGKAVAGGDGAVPDLADLRDCHSDIAKEWRRLGHGPRRHQPVHGRQTTLAVEKNPPEGHALRQLCVNCHGPIGASITGSRHAALPGDRRLERPGGDEQAQPDPGRGRELRRVPRAGGDAAGAGYGRRPLARREQSGNSSLGTFQGPPQSDPNLIPVPDHQVA